MVDSTMIMVGGVTDSNDSVGASDRIAVRTHQWQSLFQRRLVQRQSK